MELVHLRHLLLTLSTAVLLSACSDGGGSGSDDTLTGQIQSHGIGGLTYTTNSRQNTTDAQGRFEYYPGETLSLKVGELPIAQNVPAKAFVSFLDFQPELRDALKTAKVDSQNLSNHAITESSLLTNQELLNRTRFLMALNWTEVIQDGKGIDIRPRVINQLNAAINNPDLPSEVDFSIPGTEFEAPESAANQLLASICFYEEGDRLCEQPPTLADIENAPERPENDEAINPDTTYKQDLKSLRERILQSVRSIEDIDTQGAKEYLTKELAGITNAIGRQYYLSGHVASHPASDTALKNISIRKVGGDIALAKNGVEAISTRPQNVAVHTWSWQEANAEYFVDGAAGGESEILINFKPEKDYRWIRKSLRVLVTE
ncbi:organic solvent ABC transporter permease [Marinobacter litoralis]|uniref:organic solvent ABC transporter permease n=1 Tax=Marinobacter litoralis TaxID=187981 RepID=UPI0018EE4110|nr:organic solvent ABC transporter permease [Marinobacter litoralis]MBJ6138080.1 organic solvent ABC transporter permease [Marinobacter litoralis]